MERPDRMDQVDPMSNDPATTSIEGDLKKIARVGRGRRDLILVAALVAVGIVIGAVWVGFRGSHVSQGAAAMTARASPAGSSVGRPAAAP